MDHSCAWRASVVGRNHSLPNGIAAGCVIGELLVITSYPALEAIFAEQLAMLVAMLLAAAILAIRRDDLRFAGVMLAIATIKPQLVLLLGIYLFLWVLADWSRRRRLLYGAAAMLALLLIAAEITLPDWSLQWFRTIIAYRTYTLPPLAIYLFGPLLGSVALNRARSEPPYGWRGISRTVEPRRLEGFSTPLPIALAVTVVVFPTADAVYDHVLLIPAVLTLFQSTEEETRERCHPGAGPSCRVGDPVAVAFCEHNRVMELDHARYRVLGITEPSCQFEQRPRFPSF